MDPTMLRKWSRRAVTLSVMCALVMSSAWAQEQAGDSALARQFRFDWELGSVRGQWRPMCGYVYNAHHATAINVRFRVDGLDQGQQVVSSRLGYIGGDVPASGRAFFCLQVAAGAATYRVTVLTADWGYGGAP